MLWTSANTTLTNRRTQRLRGYWRCRFSRGGDRRSPRFCFRVKQKWCATHLAPRPTPDRSSSRRLTNGRLRTRPRSRSPCLRSLRRLALVEGRSPAREEVKCFGRLRAGLGGIGEDDETAVGGQIQHLVRQAEIAHDRVVKTLRAGSMDADVVRGPARAELL